MNGAADNDQMLLFHYFFEHLIVVSLKHYITKMVCTIVTKVNKIFLSWVYKKRQCVVHDGEQLLEYVNKMMNAFQRDDNVDDRNCLKIISVFTHYDSIIRVHFKYS